MFDARQSSMQDLTSYAPISRCSDGASGGSSSALCWLCRRDSLFTWDRTVKLERLAHRGIWGRCGFFSWAWCFRLWRFHLCRAAWDGW